jgi:aspartyl-tRNA(Asn)/glutamyl-tRNA(Gln) amidotransferase subunit A
MKYKNVKHFLEESKRGNVDYLDFSEKFMKELKNADKKYSLLQCTSDIKKNLDIKPGLFGLPVSAKDNICTKNIQSSAGSRILEHYKPPFDATAVLKVKEEGGVIIGKTNQDEFGFGTFSVNCAYGTPKNPLDDKRSCGGSSGGAAGLVAALNLPHIALAESTGGSISCPSAFCGVVGLTPTYGLVSRYGLIDYANSLDKIGPIAKNVEDAAIMLSIIAGHDKNDSTSLDVKKDYTKFLDKNIKGMKIGVPKEYFEGLEKEVEKEVWNSIKKLESEGARYEEISLKTTMYALSSYYIIATAEASTNLARYCGMRYGLHKELKGNFNEYFSSVRSNGFGEEAKRRIILGTFARMSGYRDAYYMKAMKVRTLIIKEFKSAFKKFDVLAGPTMPVKAPKFSDIKKLSPVQQYQMDVLTVPANLAGIPMISVPCGDKLSSGLHLMADHLKEEKIINAASVFENSQRLKK